jgi:hypothetical protein
MPWTETPAPCGVRATFPRIGSRSTWASPTPSPRFRLRLDQGDLVGRTVHRVYVKGPGTGGKFVVPHTFDGETANLDQLVYTLPEPLEGIQFVRAEIALSPSWVAFREVEVIAAK